MLKDKRIISEESLNHYRKSSHFMTMPSVEEWLSYWLEIYIEPVCKKNTYANFYSYIHGHILPIIGDYSLDKIKTIELQYYVDYKLEHGRLDGNGGLALKTVKEHISLLNNAFKKAISLQMISYNPVQCIDFPKIIQREIQILDIDEQRKIEQEIDCQYQPNSMIPILLGLYGGLRIGEICALRINDIDFIKKQIRIDESLNRIPLYYENGDVKYSLVYGTTKSDKTRYIPMNEDIYNALSLYFKKMPNNIKKSAQYPLFTNSRGSVLEPRLISIHFQKLIKKLDMPGYHFHCLRHTFATRALELKIDIKTCSKILGHSTTQITLDRYTHITSDHLQKEIRKISNATIQHMQKC